MPLTPVIKKQIIDTLKASMKNCVPPMVVSKDKKEVFELMGNKPVPYGSKKTMVPGMYFCSIVGHEEMVSFHFFPIYCHEQEFAGLIPGMIKCLKGKSCFNFKKPEQVNVKELDALLKKGIAAWKKLGYMK